MMAERNRPFGPGECGDFYQEHQSWLRGVIRNTVGTSCDVEDILQSFMLRLMEKPVPATVITERGYCYKMLKNFIIDAKRGSRTYDRHIANFAQVHAWPESHDPFRKASTTDEFCYILKKAVQNLPSRIALAVKLRLIKGYTTEEVARKMSVNKKTAVKYVSDGKSMLREILCKSLNVLIFLLSWFLVKWGVGLGFRKG